MMAAREHLAEIELLRLADGELTAEELAAAHEHLAGCAECRARSAELAETAQAWDQYYRETWKPAMPAAPEEWPEFTRLVQRRRVLPMLPRVAARIPGRWAAIAASVVLAAGALMWFIRPAELQAGELLMRAIAAEKPKQKAPVDKRVRVKTKRGTYRAASKNAEAKRVEALFAEARYDFADPLSAEAYKQWHDGLTRYRDRVEGDVARGVFVIRTTAEAGGPLEEATLELRRTDYHPVQGAWRFAGGEMVEASEVTEASQKDSDREISAGPEPDRTNAGAGNTLLSPSVPALASLSPLSQELAVFAALHQLKADLGEPIEMERAQGRLTVTATGLTQDRREQLRAALTAVPGVAVKFDEPKAQTMPAAESTAVRAEQRVEGPLSKALEGQDPDVLLDASAAMMDRAHALRALDERFAGKGAELNREEQAKLNAMREDHRGALQAEFRKLRAVLDPALPEAAAEGEAGGLLVSAQRVDQLLHTIIATPRGDTQANARELAVAVRRLARALGGP